ncbi:hypothetical protein MKX03_007432 [Papaver bracteatum]|nr:hypothetical protein MKX03_007432 [Papaver bracteatum]
MFVIANVVVAIEDDIRCLKGITAAFTVPQARLESWTFDNSSAISWSHLPTLGCCLLERKRMSFDKHFTLKFVLVLKYCTLQYCTSLKVLDLSDNKISGTFPSQICHWLPYLTNLDLSGNELSGSIPPNLGNSTYLLTLKLSSNRLSGKIPYELSKLTRLTDFIVSNNQLSGKIPTFLSIINPASFIGNKGLYGQPLPLPPAGCEKK